MNLTAGIFVFNHKNELLICHPTNGSWSKNWSIPKGQFEESETALRAAIRETFEESNINLISKTNEIKLVGKQKYEKSDKVIIGFIYKFNEETTFNLKCTSLIKDTILPENDVVKFMEFNKAVKLLHEAQQKLILDYLKKNK